MSGINQATLISSLLQIESFAFFPILISFIAAAWTRVVANPVPYEQRKLVIIPVTLFIAVFMFLAYSLGPEQILLALELAIATVLALLSPGCAACFFLAVIFLRPWEIDPTNEILLELPRSVGILAFGSLIVHRVARRELRLIWNRELLMLLLLGAWMFLSTFKSADVGATQTEFFANFFRSILVCVLLVQAVETAEDLTMMRWTILVSATTLAVMAFYLHRNYGGQVGGDTRLRSIGSLEDSNDLAAVLIMALPLALKPFFSGKVRISKTLVSIGFASLTLYGIWAAQSRGAILSLLVMFATWFAIRYRQSWAILTAILIVLAILPARGLLHRSDEDIQESSDSRIGYWEAGLKMAVYNPVLGVGYTNYPKQFEQYSVGTVYEWGNRTAHSTWILALAEGGVPALIFLGVLVWGILKKAFTLQNTYPELLYSLVGYLVAITFLSQTYLLYPYILFAAILSAARITSHVEEKTALVQP